MDLFNILVKGISRIVTLYKCSEIEAITLMQSEAAKNGDEISLEILCEIKNTLLAQKYPDLFTCDN